jgi:hypothetical protein
MTQHQYVGVPVSDVGVARTARQIARHADLLDQFRALRDGLVGKSAMVVLPGVGCRHDSNMFRPVHRQEPHFRNRPQYVTLLVGPKSTLTLNVVESRPQGGKLQYLVRRSHNYTLAPEAGAGPGARMDAKHHVLMTAANNLLQELVNTVEMPTTSLALPKLVIMTRRIKIDERKLNALAENMITAVRPLFIKKRREESEIVSHGQLFGDAELLYDSEISNAFRNGWAYEDFEDVLGAEHINPARKVFFAANPAMALLREAGVHKLGTGEKSDAIIASLLPKMRERLPWPEMATDENLLDALANPTKPVEFSISLDAMPPSVIIRAMRAALPPASALREHVTDEELLDAARKPYEPLRVSAYAKIQIFDPEELNYLPNYAVGSFTEIPAPRHMQAPVTLELAAPDPVAVEETVEEPAI